MSPNPDTKNCVGIKIVSPWWGHLGKMCRHLAVVATCRRHVGDFLSQVPQQRQQHNHNEGNNAVMTTAKTHVHQQQQHHNCQLDNGKMTAHGWRLQTVQTFAVGECTTNMPLALPLPLVLQHLFCWFYKFKLFVLVCNLFLARIGFLSKTALSWHSSERQIPHLVKFVVSLDPIFLHFQQLFVYCGNLLAFTNMNSFTIRFRFYVKNYCIKYHS